MIVFLAGKFQNLTENIFNIQFYMTSHDFIIGCVVVVSNNKQIDNLLTNNELKLIRIPQYVGHY